MSWCLSWSIIRLDRLRTSLRATQRPEKGLRQADRPEAGHRETESRKTDRESGENLSADPVPVLEDGHTETDRRSQRTDRAEYGRRVSVCV